MQYGIINSDSLAHYNSNWQGAGKPPSATALAIALAMPSVSEGGVRSQRGGLKVPGLTTYYHALTLRWADGDINAGCSDMQFSIVTAQQNPSNKTNHIKWCEQAGLIVSYRVNGIRYTMLTDAGLEQVKAVSPELAKLAKAYTVKARKALVDAAAKAAQPVKVKKAKKAKAKPVEGGTLAELVADMAVAADTVDVATFADNATDTAQAELN